MDRDKRWERTQLAYDAITRTACDSTVPAAGLLDADTAQL
jgi:Phosphoglyceromutase